MRVVKMIDVAARHGRSATVVVSKIRRPIGADRLEDNTHSADAPPQPNGDEVDARMAKIAEILRYADMRHLDKCELVAEWVRKTQSGRQSSSSPGCAYAPFSRRRAFS